MSRRDPSETQSVFAENKSVYAAAQRGHRSAHFDHWISLSNFFLAAQPVKACGCILKLLSPLQTPSLRYESLLPAHLYNKPNAWSARTKPYGGCSQYLANLEYLGAFIIQKLEITWIVFCFLVLFPFALALLFLIETFSRVSLARISDSKA